MRSKAPRKIVFIDRQFQVGFVFKFLLLLVVGTALIDAAAYFILDKRIEGTLYSAHLTLQSLREMLLPTILVLSVIFVLLVGAAVLAMTLFVSHLIAGPLYAIRRYLDNIGEGRLDFVAQLRDRDQTAPLAAALSQSLTVLNERISAIQSLGEDIEVSSKRLAIQLEAPESNLEEARSQAARLAELGSTLREEAGFFTTKPSETQG
jgi:methyl-accepting chemotaxis protein